MLTKGLREFQIDVFSLSQKLHEFEFEITDKLFSIYDQSIVKKGRGICKLSLQKAETMMTLHFDIDVEVELTCDRSLEKFWHPIRLNEKIIIKFGNDNYSLSEDVIVMRNDTPSLNVSGFIYEFIMLAVPMKKLHPLFENEVGQPDLIYTSIEDPSTEEESGTIDPRWEALKKLKGNK